MNSRYEILKEQGVKFVFEDIEQIRLTSNRMKMI